MGAVGGKGRTKGRTILGLEEVVRRPVSPTRIWPDQGSENVYDRELCRAILESCPRATTPCDAPPRFHHRVSDSRARIARGQRLCSGRPDLPQGTLLAIHGERVCFAAPETHAGSLVAMSRKSRLGRTDVRKRKAKFRRRISATTPTETPRRSIRLREIHQIISQPLIRHVVEVSWSWETFSAELCLLCLARRADNSLEMGYQAFVGFWLHCVSLLTSEYPLAKTFRS